MEVYFIRHGQSEANLKGIIQGHADFPLSSLGKKQATMVGQALANIPLNSIYSSDLQRAFHTAEAISEHHSQTIKTWKEVREVGLGPLEGLKREEMLLKYPQIKNNSLLTSGVSGTETLQSITTRCESVFNHLMENHKNESVAIVSHGGFISILLMYLMARDRWNEFNRPFIIGNTGVSKIEIDETTGAAKFHYVNQTSHLEVEGMKTSTVFY
ncbi:histidine phosphatase family protein [Evansella sp. AB-rgal1]|uniref:histidine phosphatase family protein n=1 Tax=Evansella sp. AB-rgal1 TaxID=3242696 RepID=UPI00359DA166